MSESGGEKPCAQEGKNDENNLKVLSDVARGIPLRAKVDADERSPRTCKEVLQHGYGNKSVCCMAQGRHNAVGKKKSGESCLDLIFGPPGERRVDDCRRAACAESTADYPGEKTGDISPKRMKHLGIWGPAKP